MSRITKFFTGSIRNKLIMTTVSVTLLALVIMGAYTVWVATTALQEQIEREQLAELDSISTEMTSFLQGLEEDVIFLSQSEALLQYLSSRANGMDHETVAQHRDSLEKEFFSFAQTRKIYDQVRYLDAQGNEVVRINTSPGGVSSIVQEEDLQNKVSRYYFRNSISTIPGQIFVSPLDLNVENGVVEVLPDGSNKPVIRYGTPVVHNGEIKGVVVTNVLADYFLEFLKNTDGLVYMADGDGYYLYHPDEEKRWGRDLKTNITLFDDYSEESGQQLLSGNVGVFSTGDQFFAHQPITVPNYPDVTWYLGRVVPRSVVFQPVIDFLIGFAVVSFGALLVAIIAAIIFNRILTRPIIELSEGAAAMANGDFSGRLPVKTQDEIGQLVQVYNLVGEQVQNVVANLEEQIRERTRALEASAIISRQITTILDVDQLFQDVVNRIQQTFDYYHVHIYVLNEETSQLIMREGTGTVGKQLKMNRHTLTAGQGIVGKVAVTGNALLVENVDKIEGFLRNPLLPDTQSELAVPIKQGGHLVGVLDLQSEIVGRFTHDDLNLMQSIADQIAVAMENAHLFEQAQRTAEEARELSRQLTRETWSKADALLPAPGYVFTKTGITPTPSDWLPAMEHAINKRNLVQEQSNGNGQDNLTSVAIPLVLRDEVIGVIGVERPTDRRWSEDELETIRAVSDQVSLALESARLSKETERAAWRDHVVSESTTRIWSSAEIEEVMKAAVAQLGTTLDAAEVVIRLGTEEELVIDQAVGEE